MSLHTSVQINDITPAGSSNYLLELVISAWELHQELEWTLFSWYADLNLSATGLQIQEIIPTSPYDNQYFNADLTENRTGIDALGFTGNPFASKNRDLFHLSTILVSLTHLPSAEHPLSIELGPVQSSFNQAKTISLQTVAASKQLYPGITPSPSHNLADEIGRIQESVAFTSDQLTTGILLLSRYNHPPSLAVTALTLPGSEDAIQLMTVGTLLNDLGVSDPEQEKAAIKIVTVHSEQLELQGGNTWTPLTAGTVLNTPEAIIRWTPPADQAGTLKLFTAGAWDGEATSAQEALISINLAPIDDPAVVTRGTTGSGNEDTIITGTLLATDVEGLTDRSVFSIANGNGPANGSASIAPSTGAWTYKPNANFNGTDSFTVTITDDLNGTTKQTINLSVLKNPDANSPQYITFTPSETIHYSASDTIAIQLSLHTGERDANLGDTNLNIHYNSTILTPASLNNGTSALIGADSSSLLLADDTDNLDGDNYTDKIIQLNWDSGYVATPSNGIRPTIATLSFATSRRLIDPLSGQILETRLNLSSPESAIIHDPDKASLSLKPNFNYDVDGDGLMSAVSDGLMILQKLFGTGLPDDAIINGAASINGSRSTASEIQNWLELGIEGGAFDVDRDGETNALSDGMMIMRHLIGLSTGNELIDSFTSNLIP